MTNPSSHQQFTESISSRLVIPHDSRPSLINFTDTPDTLQMTDSSAANTRLHMSSRIYPVYHVTNDHVGNESPSVPSQCPSPDQPHAVNHATSENTATGFFHMDSRIQMPSRNTYCPVYHVPSQYQPQVINPHATSENTATGVSHMDSRNTQIYPDISVTHGEHTQLAAIYSNVARTRQHNYQLARIPLRHDLNISAWRTQLRNYADYDICDFLEFGWPMNYTAQYPPTPTQNNHASARAFKSDIDQYIHTEIAHHTLAGPFTDPPFTPWFQTSPLMTRPKKTGTSRRVILDLSFPTGQSVNDGIPRDIYLGKPYKLRLPTVDDLVSAILQHGPECFIYSIDLARAYRQLRCDPLDWPLLGIWWNDSYYFDTGISFGSRWGSMACQRTTNAICHILSKQNQRCYPYIDDIAGVSCSQAQATADFMALRGLLVQLGVQEAVDKATLPSRVATWIGIEFDTIQMQIRMPQAKITDTLSTLHDWTCKYTASKHQLQQLLGKLFHIAQCVKPARLFLGRMLTLLRAENSTVSIRLTDEFKKDVSWFTKFLPSYNGIHMIRPSIADVEVHVDSCLTGCGGHWDTHYYHTMFPALTLHANHPICHLELLNIVIALRVWGEMWRHKNVLLYSDNAATVCILSNGRSRDTFMMTCARNVWLIISSLNISLTVRHKPGRDMETADCLSRSHLHTSFREKLSYLINLDNSERHHIHDHMFELDSDL